MKVINTGKYKCPYCGTIVELTQDDIYWWNNVYYYHCPTCRATPHISHTAFDNWICPYDIKGKKAIKIE